MTEFSLLLSVILKYRALEVELQDLPLYANLQTGFSYISLHEKPICILVNNLLFKSAFCCASFSCICLYLSKLVAQVLKSVFEID